MDGTDRSSAEANLSERPRGRTCLLILGMHRSGTSALTRTLSLAGATLPDKVIDAGLGNETGHWEPARIQELNDLLLAEAGSSWDDWRPVDWTNLPAHRRFFYKSEISRLIEEEYGAAQLFVLKEPRICRLIPIYLDVLSELGIETRLIIPFRNPLAVSASLQSRDGIHPMVSQLYWIRHVIDAERDTRGLPRTFLDYDSLMSDWKSSIEKMRVDLNMEAFEPTSEVSAKIDSFLTKDLRHFKSSKRALDTSDTVSEWTKTAFAAFKRLQTDATSESAQKMLDDVRQSFDRSVSLFGYHFASLKLERTNAREQAAHLEQELNALKAELANERIEAADRIAQLDAAGHDARSELASVQADFSQTQAAFDAADADRIALRAYISVKETAIAEGQAAIIQLRDAMNMREREFVTLNDAFLAIQAELHSSEQGASALRIRFSGLEAQFDRSREDYAALQRALNQTVAEFQASSSWKLTRPFRAVRRIPALLRERKEVVALRKSGLFDAEWYVRQYPDVLSSGLDAAIHFLRYGGQEGRSPSGQFDSRFYLQTYPDVADSGSNPLIHFLKFGRNERRLATRPGARLPEAPAKPDARLPAASPTGTPYLHAAPARDAAVEALTSDPRRPDMSIPIAQDDCTLITFYLPQYHRIVENSEWWSPGFTEWTNVARGQPNFVDHYQPHIPRELGYYDLGDVSVMREQAELARLYGVGGFCFYHYWFSGRRILERPVSQFLESDIDIKFCLCWANENWTRTWDGDTKSVLLEQHYGNSDAIAFISDILPALKDPRYIRVDGLPLLVVYRAKDIPDASAWFAIWRQYARENGLDGLHISVVDFYDIETPMEVGADSMVEFPPHKFNGAGSHPDIHPEFTDNDFAGSLVDYTKVMAQSASRPKPDFQLFRGIIPSWDNTARRQHTPTIVCNAQPSLYGRWLNYLRRYTRCVNDQADRRLIFVNAWNEWGEGCHLEPDMKWGLAYLEETLRSKFNSGSGSVQPGELDEAANQLRQLSGSGHAPPKSALVALAAATPSPVEPFGEEAITFGATLVPARAKAPRSPFVVNCARIFSCWPLAYRAVRTTFRTLTRRGVAA